METWLALLVVAVGGLIAALMGLHAYVTLTATRLHPEPGSVTSVSRTAPAPRWAEAAERARQVARAALSEQNLPGLSIAVGAGDEIVWAEGFGWANLEDRVPVSPETRFRIGTASTVLTSVAVGRLLEQGRLALDDEIQARVPAFPRKPWPVTLRQLMAHTAGVRNDGGDESPLFSRNCDSPVEGLDVFAGRPLLFEPGTRFRYSSFGWILVSAAVEQAAGDSFLRVMREQVFEPAGMRDTREDVPAEASTRQATAYFPRYAADPDYGLHLMRPIDSSCYAGAGAFVSTPSDLVRFGLAVARGTLLRPETVQLFQTSQRLPSGEQTGYGLGWDLETVALPGGPARVAGHDGDVLGGRVASLMTFPEHGLVVAVTSNISYADTFAIGADVARAFIERPTRQSRR